MIRRRIRVLVVDDNKGLRVTIERMLKNIFESAQIEISVVQATSGPEAVQTFTNALANNPFELITMDWNMPGGMTGFEAAQAIRVKFNETTSQLLPKNLVIFGCSDDFFRNKELAEIKECINQTFTKPLIKVYLKEAITISMGIEFPKVEQPKLVAGARGAVPPTGRKLSLVYPPAAAMEDTEDDREDNDRRKHKSVDFSHSKGNFSSRNRRSTMTVIKEAGVNDKKNEQTEALDSSNSSDDDAAATTTVTDKSNRKNAIK